MKPERAQELYSDYAEGTLAPALRQALDQHFDTDPSARGDYARFARVYTLLEQPLEAEVDVPLGFRSKILEQAAAGQAERETTFTTRAAGTVTGWFSTVPHRRLTGGALAGLAAAALIGILFVHPGHSGDQGSLLPITSQPMMLVDPAVIQKVDTQMGQDNNNYHQFHLHLPPSVPAAMVNAYVVTATEQITDPAHLGDATPALKEHLDNHLGVSIPIAATVAPPAGETLNLLVQWTPDDPKLAHGSEVVFTPYGAANPAAPSPAGANFLDAMQATASHYGATVVVDADAVPTQTVSGDFSAPDAGTPLQAMAKSVGYSVQTLPGNTFYVYDPKS